MTKTTSKMEQAKRFDQPKKDYKKPTVEVVYYQVEKGFQTSSQPQPDEQEFLQTERFTEDGNNSGDNFWGQPQQ